MIYESVSFLDLRDGNRIGHATAVGINQKLWKEKVGKIVIMKKGEYLVAITVKA